MATPNASRVRELREANGWNQAELARRIRRTRQAVSLIETGRRPVSEAMMRKVARAFRVTIAEVILLPADSGEKQEEMPEPALRQAS